MDRQDALPKENATRQADSEKLEFADRYGYLRPGRYFHFYLLYEPVAGKSCWLPDGYHT